MITRRGASSIIRNRQLSHLGYHISGKHLHTDYRSLPIDQVKFHLLSHITTSAHRKCPLQSLIKQIQDKSGRPSGLVLPYDQDPVDTSSDTSQSVLLLANIVTSPAGTLSPRVDIASAFVLHSKHLILTVCHVFDMIAPVVPNAGKGTSTCGRWSFVVYQNIQI